MARPYAAEHAAWFFLDLGAVYLDWHGYPHPIILWTGTRLLVVTF